MNGRQIQPKKAKERVKLVIVFTLKWHRFGQFVNGGESIINRLDVIALPRLSCHGHASYSHFFFQRIDRWSWALRRVADI